ncbi:alpha/beta fold hydrolase [Paenibacillus mesotrionivorans]|uniref:Alpha/beta fold hydrolase n=1 Tax=Paenibacillus mesotrionivorans TaxID=3160968 RepID=A0ACC7P251_9BACL
MALHFLECGNKDAFLLMQFIHGGGVSGWMWDQQIRYFGHYHCIVPDLHGRGRSKDGEFSIRGSAEALLRLLDEKATGKKVVVTGFSLGSQILIQMLSLKPDAIHFAIINSALARPFPSAKYWIRPAIQLSYPLIKYRWFSKLQARSLYINGENFEAYYEESRQVQVNTLVRVLNENMSFELPGDFRMATGKILVTVGEKEKAIMKKSARDIVEANRACTGVLLPQIGHGAPLAKPGLFNEMVDNWIHERELPEICLKLN